MCSLEKTLWHQWWLRDLCARLGDQEQIFVTCNVVCKWLLLAGWLPARNWECSRKTVVCVAYLCIAAPGISVGGCGVAGLTSPWIHWLGGVGRRLCLQAPTPAFVKGWAGCRMNYGDRFHFLSGKWRDGVSGKAERGEVSWRCGPLWAEQQIIPQSHQPSLLKPKCSSSRKRCINKPRPDTTGSKSWLECGNVNLIKGMSLSEGSRLEEELLILVSVPNSQSEQTPGIFPGIRSHVRGTSCYFSTSWREPSRGVNSKCCCSPADPVAVGRSVVNWNRGLLGTKIWQKGYSRPLPLSLTDCSELVETLLYFNEKWVKINGSACSSGCLTCFPLPVSSMLSCSADTGLF